ncbi:MAG TPA: sigma-70 family RNA polymerase sigma factor [Gillisia sp.]|nr:sigma-70 family RNA polymerase sigma factor [Gillisia sp.]
MEINNTYLLDQIEQAKAGQQAAFKYLLDSFWGDVYAYQLKRTRNEYDAEEVTIQTFSRAFDKLHTYDQKFVFKTWLITISKNIHIDLVRKTNASIRSRTADESNESIQRIADETPTIEDSLINEQHLAQLLSDIKQLKPPYREVITLRYFQEKTYKEIASELDEPLNNIKVKLLRAKKLLSQIIESRKAGKA